MWYILSCNECHKQTTRINPHFGNRFRHFLYKEEEIPYDFFLNDVEIDDSLQGTMDRVDSLDTENRIEIVYQPQAVFRVRAVTRCTTTNAGHTDAVIATSFSPDGR